MIILSFYLLITIIAVCNVNYSSAQQQIICDFKFDIDHNVVVVVVTRMTSYIDVVVACAWHSSMRMPGERVTVSLRP